MVWKVILSSPLIRMSQISQTGLRLFSNLSDLSIQRPLIISINHLYSIPGTPEGFVPTQEGVEWEVAGEFHCCASSKLKVVLYSIRFIYYIYTYILIIFQIVPGTRIALGVVNVEADVEVARTRPNRGANESLRASIFFFATTTIDGRANVPARPRPRGWWIFAGMCLTDVNTSFFVSFHSF